jgi:beta-phosphoglucomutase
MNKSLGALIFDYDGVVADTEPLHWRSWAKLLLPYKIEMTWEEYCGCGRGVDDVQLCGLIAKKWPHVNPNALLERNPERKRMVREWSLAELPISPETSALLRSLCAFQIGLVTSSESSSVEPVLNACGVLDAFDALVFGEDVVAPKPSPEPYLLMKQRLGIVTGIAFEDSTPGVESALAAGLQVVRVESPRDLARLVESSIRLTK